MMRLDDIQVFLEISRNGTLSKTATQLNCGIATVSRHLQRLEESLGYKLFKRHQTGYKLTEEAKSLIPLAENIEKYGLLFINQAKNEAEIKGLVRIATSDNLCNYLFMPFLKSLMQKYPKLVIEFYSGIDVVNMQQLKTDIAIRTIKPTLGNLKIRKLADMGFGIYAHSNKIKTKQLDQLEYIGWNSEFENLETALWMKDNLNSDNCVVKVSSLQSQIFATQAGIGVSVLPHFLAKAHHLMCIKHLKLSQPVWLVMQNELSQSPRIRAVAQFLSKCITQHEDFA